MTSAGLLERIAELGFMIRLSCLISRSSRLGSGSGLFCGIFGRVGRPAFGSAFWTPICPPVGRGRWSFPERFFLCFPQQVEGSPRSACKCKASEGSSRLRPPVVAGRRNPKSPPESPGLGVPTPWSSGRPLPMSRSSAHLVLGRQTASSPSPQEARSGGSCHRAASALARNKRLKILGSASRREEPGAQSAIKDELWVS